MGCVGLIIKKHRGDGEESKNREMNSSEENNEKLISLSLRFFFCFCHVGTFIHVQVRIDVLDKRSVTYVDPSVFAGAGHTLGQKALPLSQLGGLNFTRLTPRGYAHFYHDILLIPHFLRLSALIFLHFLFLATQPAPCSSIFHITNSTICSSHDAVLVLYSLDFRVPLLWNLCFHLPPSLFVHQVPSADASHDSS